MGAVIEPVARKIRRSLVAALATVVAASCSSAWASLGQDVASVESDRAQMQGSRSVTEAQDYVIHEIEAPTGTVVREYARPDGTVFAIAWQGPFIPNLRQLLGAYFAPFAEVAKAQQSRHARRGTVVVETPDLVVETGGHMRAFFGRAYIPALMPRAFAAGELR
jgi:uncharacterized protein DUF2844